MNNNVTVYTTIDCPTCKALKLYLHNRNIQYNDKNMSAVENLTELRLKRVFTTSAPVLQVDDDFYTIEQILKNHVLTTEFLDMILME